MTDRKKLMEMICEAVQTDRCVRNCNHPHCNMVQILCDHLISKGVKIPVLCKDCKHWKHLSHIGCTDFVKLCGLANYMIGENGYCLYGERKSNEQQK